MIEINGANNKALCFASTLESTAESQIKTICDMKEFADCKIRIMPDVHAGKGCTIGTTMTIRDKIVPNMVGVDIGCGMEAVKLKNNHIEFNKLDKVIREFIPSGMDIRQDEHDFNNNMDLNELRCADEVNLSRARRSIGTLGGGNHFIEIDKGENGALWLVIHSGSRHLGLEIAEYYQNQGRLALQGAAKFQIDELIKNFKAQGRQKEIASPIKELKKGRDDLNIPRDLAWVEGKLFEDYIHDMSIAQKFALLNRKAMADVIIRKMKLKPEDSFTTIHNYIDINNMIMRKGAVSAQKGEKLLIPINMRDGSLICKGLGNPDWNCSAPHGAGRLMSRAAARASLSMSEYKAEMSGIFSTSISHDTIDEAPMAYKSLDEIAANITPTAEIIEQIKPVYNFKAAE